MVMFKYKGDLVLAIPLVLLVLQLFYGIFLADYSMSVAPSIAALFFVTVIIFLAMFFCPMGISPWRFGRERDEKMVRRLLWGLSVFLVVILYRNYSFNTDIYLGILNEGASANRRDFFDLERRNFVYGGSYGYFVAQYFIHFAIFATFYLTFSSGNKFPIFIFWVAYVLVDLMAFGRFGLYQALIFYLLKFSQTRQGHFKHIVMISVGVLSSYLVASVRTNIEFSKYILALAEVHAVPLSIGIEGISRYEPDNFFMVSSIGAFAFPFFSVFGWESGALPAAVYGQIFDPFIFESSLTGKIYNAYGTVFSHFYLDVGWLMPMMAVILWLMVFIIARARRYDGTSFVDYATWILFFSLFQSQITAFGFSFVNFVFVGVFILRKPGRVS